MVKTIGGTEGGGSLVCKDVGTAVPIANIWCNSGHPFTRATVVAQLQRKCGLRFGISRRLVGCYSV